METTKLSPKAISKAVKALQGGGVVVFPTDTVYGFLADASNRKAVKKIYQIKQRPASKPLPLFVKNFSAAKGISQINKEQEVFLKKMWPGKITIVLRRKKGIHLYGVDKKTIALRMPNHPLLLTLIKRVNRPLAQTSVNKSGQPPLRSAKGIAAQFGSDETVALIVDAGTLKKSKPSKIIDWSRDAINVLRP